MTSAVLDRPVDLPFDDFAIACAIHEIAEGRPPCGRQATLTIRVHTCLTTVSCQECWNSLVAFMKRVQQERMNDLVAGVLGGWRCMTCKMQAKTFEDLMWAEPL